MAIIKKTEIVLDHKFDPRSCRHTINGELHVLHCHHYATLYTRLADDCGMLDGKKLLVDVAEDCFYELLTKYYAAHNIESIDDRFSIAEQYYAAAGLGQMEVLCAGTESGEVKLLHSHLDEGWINKWEKRDTPVNFMTCGYIAAIFSAAFDRPTRTFSVLEKESIISGAEHSLFDIVAK